jgi:hypothetical protein
MLTLERATKTRHSGLKLNRMEILLGATMLRRWVPGSRLWRLPVPGV